MTQQLDFGELANMDLPGPALENLVRVMLPKIFEGCEVDWTGIGSDDQKDLKATYVENESKFSWLVSCKNYPNGSVGPNDFPNIPNRLFQHKCDGFLMVTTGGVTSGAKNLIDDIDGTEVAKDKFIRAQIWDKTTLREYLVQPKFREIVIIYFPKSAAALAAADVLDSVSLKSILEDLAWKDSNAATRMAIAVIEQCKNEVIAKSMTECALKEIEMSEGELYELLYEFTSSYGEQSYGENWLTQKLSDFLSDADNSNLAIDLMNKINAYAVLEEAYVNSVKVYTEDDDLLFEADVNVSGLLGAKVFGKISEEGFSAHDTQPYHLPENWDDEPYSDEEAPNSESTVNIDLTDESSNENQTKDGLTAKDLLG